MVPELVAAIQGLKNLSELVKGANNLVNQHAIATAVSDVTFKLMEAQTVLLSIQEEHGRDRTRIRDLEMKLEQMDEWKTEAARYKLQELVPGRLVYSLKPEAANGEPRHFLCANCFGEHKKSILQLDNHLWFCQKCNTSLSKYGFLPHPVNNFTRNFS